MLAEILAEEEAQKAELGIEDKGPKKERKKKKKSKSKAKKDEL
jgi:hypothetical protein